MAGEVLAVKDLVAYMKGVRSLLVRANLLTLIEVAQNAQALAKSNATKQFTGRWGRTLTGRLLNSIFTGFTQNKGELPDAFIGTRGIPYGAIQELGGTIKPVNAKYLWMKNHNAPKKFKRLTPSEFVAMTKDRRNGFKYRGRTAGVETVKRGAKGSKQVREFVPLFFLLKSAKIPPRPYLTPAAKESVKGYAARGNRNIRVLLSQRFFGKG